MKSDSINDPVKYYMTLIQNIASCIDYSPGMFVVIVVSDANITSPLLIFVISTRVYVQTIYFIF